MLQPQSLQPTLVVFAASTSNILVNKRKEVLVYSGESHVWSGFVMLWSPMMCVAADLLFLRRGSAPKYVRAAKVPTLATLHVEAPEGA